MTFFNQPRLGPSQLNRASGHRMQDRHNKPHIKMFTRVGCFKFFIEIIGLQAQAPKLKPKMKKFYHDRKLRQKLGRHLFFQIPTPTRVAPKGKNPKNGMILCRLRRRN